MFRPDRLLVRTYSCTAVPVPVPVPVAGIYYCTSNCAYACMRAVQNCMLARASAPEKFYRLFHYRRSKSVPNRLKTIGLCSGLTDYWYEPIHYTGTRSSTAKLYSCTCTCTGTGRIPVVLHPTGTCTCRIPVVLHPYQYSCTS